MEPKILNLNKLLGTGEKQVTAFALLFCRQSTIF